MPHRGTKGFVLAAAIVGFVLAAPPLRAAVEGKEIAYAAGGVTLKGYLAWDGALAGRRPGVLVVHEWWGHNEYARRRARMLAELGYVALAVDMFGEGRTADHPDTAAKLAAAVTGDAGVMRARFLAALETLRAQPQTDPARVAAVGYCMGGGVALNMARAGVDLRGVVSVHGSLAAAAPAAPGSIKAKLLVLHGEADSFIPPEAVEAFRKEMAEAKADLTFIAYPGAKHSFSNPEADELARRFGMPVAYSPEADAKSWEELRRFLAAVFAP